MSAAARFGAALGLALASVSCASSAGSPWAQQRGTEAKTAVTQLQLPDAVKVRWAERFPASGCPSFNFHYAVQDSAGALYATSGDGYSEQGCVVKFSSLSGKPEWVVNITQHSGVFINYEPALALSADEKRVYVGGAPEKQVAALSAESGALLWEAGDKHTWCITLDRFDHNGASFLACWGVYTEEGTNLYVWRDNGDHATLAWMKPAKSCGESTSSAVAGTSAMQLAGGEKLLFSFSHYYCYPETETTVWAVKLETGEEVWSTALGYSPSSLQAPIVLEEQGALLLSLSALFGDDSCSRVVLVNATSGAKLADAPASDCDSHEIGQGTVLGAGEVGIFPLTPRPNSDFTTTCIVRAFNLSGNISHMWDLELDFYKCDFSSVLADTLGNVIVSTAIASAWPHSDDHILPEMECFVIGFGGAGKDLAKAPSMQYNVSLAAEFGRYDHAHRALSIERWGMETIMTSEGIWSPCGPWHGVLTQA